MKSSDYWQNRFKAIEESNHDTAKDAVQSVTPAFDKAQRQIDSEINAWYQRYAQNNQISLQEAKIQLNAKELKELKWDIKDYIKAGQENAVDQRWMKELENASAKYHITRLEALKIRTQNAAELAFGNEQDALDQLAARIYTDDYYHTAFEIQKGLGIGWDIGTIDQNKLDKLLKKPWTTDGQTFSDRIWKSKTQLVDSLSTQLTQMCILGKAPDEAIKNISHAMGVSKNQAGRLIMTESAYFASAAQKDCFNELDVQMYEIVATLDSHTSEICQQMDGQHFDMKDYQAGVTAPPFHVWCRSTTVPFFDDEWGREGTRAARGEDGKTYQVPADMKYSDWKDHFVDKTKDPADWMKKAEPEQKESLKEKIQKIKDQIAKNNGIIEESHLQEAGKAVKEELKNSDHFKEILKAKNDMDSMDVNYKTALKNFDAFKTANPEIHKAGLDYDFWKKMYNGDPSNERLKQKMLEYEQELKKFDPDLVSMYQKLHKESNDFYDEWYKLKTKYNKMNSAHSNADKVKEILSQVREMGSEGIDITSHLNKSRSPMRKVIEDAYSYYPKDWVNASVQMGNLTPKKVDRGYYSDWDKVIAISGSGGDSSFETAIHELGHRMERAVSGIKPSEKVFYNRRTAGEQLAWLGNSYDKTEVSRKDNFIHSYMGKDYGGSAYELVSMGFEYAYVDPMKLMSDEDMANWIYGLLCLD